MLHGPRIWTERSREWGREEEYFPNPISILVGDIFVFEFLLSVPPFTLIVTCNFFPEQNFNTISSEFGMMNDFHILCLTHQTLVIWFRSTGEWIKDWKERIIWEKGETGLCLESSSFSSLLYSCHPWVAEQGWESFQIQIQHVQSINKDNSRKFSNVHSTMKSLSLSLMFELLCDFISSRSEFCDFFFQFRFVNRTESICIYLHLSFTIFFHLTLKVLSFLWIVMKLFIFINWIRTRYNAQHTRFKMKTNPKCHLSLLLSKPF